MKCAWQELLGILPMWLRQDVDKLGRDTLQEIRLRLGKPPELVLKDRRINLKRAVMADDIHFAVNTACRYSPWTADGAASGYITAPGGHRIGLCGETVVQNGSMTGIRSVRSLNIRVARDFPGIGLSLAAYPGSMLILGRPGCGKTTLLRDLIRQLSEKENVSVVDERGELFPVCAGINCFDTGKRTDVLTGCPKAQGLDAVLRTMSPDTIAVDEITAAADCEALIRAGWCGVRLLATLHAASRKDLYSRSVYQPIVKSRLFETLVILQPDKSWRTERMEP